MAKLDCASLPPDIPEDVNAELHQCSKYHVDLSKIALYALREEFTETDLRKACTAIHDTYLQNVFPGKDSSAVSEFVFPAPDWTSTPAHVQMTIQELLRYHVLGFDKGWKDSAGKNEGDLDWYPFGFALIMSRNRKSEGIVFVHCDPRNGEDWTSFKTGTCVLPIEEVGIALFSVQWGDDDFEKIQEMAPDMWKKREERGEV